MTYDKLKVGVCKLMRDTFFENSMNQLGKKHGRASKMLWNTSCETEEGQITRMLCKIC
jgi:hypothetical protein